GPVARVSGREDRRPVRRAGLIGGRRAGDGARFDRERSTPGWAASMTSEWNDGLYLDPICRLPRVPRAHGRRARRRGEGAPAPQRGGEGAPDRRFFLAPRGHLAAEL